MEIMRHEKDSEAHRVCLYLYASYLLDPPAVFHLRLRGSTSLIEWASLNETTSFPFAS